MMKKHGMTAALIAATLGATLGLAGCGSNDTGGMGGMSPSNDASPQMSQMPSPMASTGSSAGTAGQFNAADVMFVQRMIPHHQQAVAMSAALLKKSGVSAGTTVLAQQIKAAQQPEITTMEGWLTTWGVDLGANMDGMDQGDDGMATAAEMKTFDQANGAAAEKMYLEMMTKHHQGAIVMAQAETTDGTNTDAVALAGNILTSQQREIIAMKKLLASL